VGREAVVVLEVAEGAFEVEELPAGRNTNRTKNKRIFLPPQPHSTTRAKLAY